MCREWKEEEVTTGGYKGRTGGGIGAATSVTKKSMYPFLL